MSLLSWLFWRHPAEEHTSAWKPTPSHADTYQRTRRHLPDLPYTLPKDEQEEQRINFQHHFLYHLLGSHTLAPLDEQLHGILDVGSGTGRWAHEMARLYPLSQVIGLDIEPPSQNIAPPPNYRFVQGNVLTGLPFADQSFDYVHQRLLVAALPAPRWPFVLSELVRVTRPSGWVELVEGSDSYHHVGPSMQQFLLWGKIACLAKEIDVSLIKQLDTMLTHAGLQHVTLRTVRAPVGAWAGRQGDVFAKDMYAAFVGLKDFYCTHVGNLTPEQFEETLATLPAEWERYHTAYEFYVVYGQRR